MNDSGKNQLPLTRAEKNARALATGHLMEDLGRRTVAGGAIAISAQGVGLLLQLTNTAIMARLLAPTDFGLVAMAAIVTVFVGLFVDLGLSAATIQRKEIDQDTVSALFFVNQVLGVVIMLAACLAAPAAAWFFGDERLFWLVVAMSATMPFTAAGAQHRALLARGMRWVTIHWTTVFSQALGITVGVFAAWKLDLGYWSLVAGAWTTALSLSVLLWIVSPWRPTRVRDWTGAKSAINFGLNLTGFSLVNYFHRQLDNTLIGWQWGAAELGFYTRAYSLLMMPLSLINGPVSSAVIPSLSRLQDKPERWRRAYLEALALVTLLGSGLAAILIAAAEPLVRTLLGPGWGQSAAILQLLSISLFASIPMNTVGWIFVSLGRTGRMLKWALLFVPVIALTFIITVQFGVTVLALSYSLILLAGALPCFAFASKDTSLSTWQIFRQILPYLFSGAVAAAVCVLTDADAAPGFMGLVIPVALAGGLYSIFCAAIIFMDPYQEPIRLRLTNLAGDLWNRLRAIGDKK